MISDGIVTKYYWLQNALCVPTLHKAFATSGTQGLLAYDPLWWCDPETPLWICKQLAHWEAEFRQIQYEPMAQSQGEAESRW